MKESTFEIAIFPLPLILLPGEEASLHLFEPRYLKLLEECAKKDNTFGIPYKQEGEDVCDRGSIVQVIEMDDEEGDKDRKNIQIRSIGIFEIQEHHPSEDEENYDRAVIRKVELAHTLPSDTLMEWFEKYRSTLPPEERDMTTNPGIWEIASILPLTSDEKYRALSCDSRERVDRYLIQRIMFELNLFQQEMLTEDGFYLN